MGKRSWKRFTFWNQRIKLNFHAKNYLWYFHLKSSQSLFWSSNWWLKDYLCSSPCRCLCLTGPPNLRLWCDRKSPSWLSIFWFGNFLCPQRKLDPDRRRWRCRAAWILCLWPRGTQKRWGAGCDRWRRKTEDNLWRVGRKWEPRKEGQTVNKAGCN